MGYKHGAYGELVPSQEQLIAYGKGTIPVYIGVAPVHRVNDYSSMVNTPILIRSLEEAKTKLGYSAADKFKDFTISAAVYAHFQNRIKPIGPIVVVNVLNPDKNKKGETKQLTLINGKGVIDDYVIVNSIKIEGKALGVHYNITASKDGKVQIESVKDGLSSPVQVAFEKIDISSINQDDIIGGYDLATDKRSGIACLESIFEELNIVPSIVSCPGFNHIPLVEKELVATCKKIGEHWDAICVTDIDPSVTTLEEAKKWKFEKGYNSNNEKVCWPMGKIGDKAIWMSILAIVRMQQTDTENNNVPYETPSNKEIDISGLIVNDKDYKINSVQANKLNEKGITTALYFGGKWVLWGPHMANFEYGVTNKPDEIFDVNIRTNIYLSNDFQLRNIDLIDKPIARNDLDAIINKEQLKLNALVADGKILYGAIEFRSKDNVKSDLVQGDFVFSTMVTNTPPGKSLTNRIQYTSKGIDTLMGRE